jgi:hypothetical protein
MPYLMLQLLNIPQSLLIEWHAPPDKGETMVNQYNVNMPACW